VLPNDIYKKCDCAHKVPSFVMTFCSLLIDIDLAKQFTRIVRAR